MLTPVTHPFGLVVCSKLGYRPPLRGSVLTHNSSYFNCLYENVVDGIDTRDGAQVLVEDNVFVNTKKPVFSDFSAAPGFAVLRDNDLGGVQVSVETGNFTQAPYSYALDSLDTVRSQVPSEAGATLNIS